MKIIQCFGLVLCGLFVLASFASDEASPRAILVKPLEKGPPGRVELTIDKGCGAVYQFGEKLVIKVWSERSGYLTIFDFWPDKTAHIIFPNQYYQNNWIEGGKWYTIPGDLFPFEFQVAPPAGEEVLFAVVTEKKIDYIPSQYYEFTKVFPELPGGATQAAEAISRGLEVLPQGEWWGAAMCFFRAGSVPQSEGWGLFIGLNRYEYAPLSWVTLDGGSYRLPDLTYAMADAQALAAALTATFSQQRVLTDGQATRQAIKEAITVWLSQAPPQALVLLYFAGHGGRVRDKDGDEADGWDECLISYDRDFIVDDELALWLAQLRAEKVLVILDTSFCGAPKAGARTFRIPEDTSLPPLTDGFAEDFLQPRTRGLKIDVFHALVLSASAPFEAAWEAGDLGHGVLSYYLLEGLNGAADSNKDGIVTIQELFAYADSIIPKRYQQKPALFDPVAEPIPLLKLR
jgi:hypothetical protein